jgi:hypothetical protein
MSITLKRRAVVIDLCDIQEPKQAKTSQTVKVAKTEEFHADQPVAKETSKGITMLLPAEVEWNKVQAIIGEKRFNDLTAEQQRKFRAMMIERKLSRRLPKTRKGSASQKFLLSLQEQYNKNGYLSDKQYWALMMKPKSQRNIQ